MQDTAPSPDSSPLSREVLPKIDWTAEGIVGDTSNDPRVTSSETPVLETAGGPPSATSGASLAPPTPAPTDAGMESGSWRAELASIARSSWEWARRPRVRLALIGAMLLVIGGLVISSSVWTLPLVIAGALMVAIAWIGHRLDGRFVIEWGQAGTELAFRATVKAAQPAAGAAPRISSRPQRLVLDHRSEPESARVGPTSSQVGPEFSQVIDGDAHTVEIDIAELKALIAAAETRDADTDAVGGSPQDIRIRRVAPDSGRPPEASR